MKHLNERELGHIAMLLEMKKDEVLKLKFELGRELIYARKDYLAITPNLRDVNVPSKIYGALLTLEAAIADSRIEEEAGFIDVALKILEAGYENAEAVL